MNLLQVRESGIFKFSNDDVETVFKISRDIFNGNFDDIKDKYGRRDIKSELVAVNGKITESEDIVRQAGCGQEVMNMCTVLEKLKRAGIEQGIEVKTKEIVRNMLQLGMEYDVIEKAAGVTAYEIKQIEDNL